MASLQHARDPAGRGVLLQELPLALLTAVNLDDVLRLVARHVMDALQYEDCVIYVHEGSGRLVQRAAWGPKSPNGIDIVDPLVLQLGQGIVGIAAQTRQTQLIVDTLDAPGYISDIAGGRSELAVPILFESELLGVIDSEHPTRGFFTSEDAEVITLIAAIAAARMHSAITTKELEVAVEELDRTRIRLERSVETDALTNIGNRRCFVRQLNDAVASGARFGVCAIDLDNFKAANDAHGHHQGDQILRQVASVLDDTFAQSDALTARVGGDEFVVLQRPVTDDFRALCQHAIGQIQTFEIAGLGADHNVTASAGVAFGSSLDTWHKADDALYVAKSYGGNSVETFDPNNQRLVALRSGRSWANRIHTAMNGNGLQLVVQAVTPAKDIAAQPPFYEVLLRFRDTGGEWQSPTEVLMAAAKLGLETDIDRWVLDGVMTALTCGPASLCLATNWSVASMSSPWMTQHLVEQLRMFEIDPARLIIEVTEHGCIESPVAFRQAVQAIRAEGVRVAIDDLGSGWTSLKLLRENPVDFIKLDGNWVSNATTDELSRIAVKSMIDCAHQLGADVIAEWVEDEPTRRLIAELGAEFVQGWLIHRPVPLDDLLALSAEDISK